MKPISTKNRLPEEFQKVFWWNSASSKWYAGRYYLSPLPKHAGGLFAGPGGAKHRVKDGNVTHWLPQPDITEEEEHSVEVDKTLIQKTLHVLYGVEDAGPEGEGWHSDKLMALIKSLEAAVECDCGC